jgi:D-tyrosyl-tRNA(Tyr) deacylase
LRAVVQRVSEAAVAVEGRGPRRIKNGLMVLLGVAPSDGVPQAKWLADKICNLRIFPDDKGLMNKSVLDHNGGVLVVSQFTLYGDSRKGRRPSFVGAAGPELARPLYEEFTRFVREAGVSPVETGVFGAHMDISLVNSGPVTLILDTEVGPRE